MRQVYFWVSFLIILSFVFVYWLYFNWWDWYKIFNFLLQKKEKILSEKINKLENKTTESKASLVKSGNDLISDNLIVSGNTSKTFEEKFQSETGKNKNDFSSGVKLNTNFKKTDQYTGDNNFQIFKINHHKEKRYIVKLKWFDFLGWEKFDDFSKFIPFSFLSWSIKFTWYCFISWDILYFTSSDFSCKFVNKFLYTGSVVLFTDKNLIKRNKFPGERICFINFSQYKKKLVFFWFLRDWNWYWFQVPYEKYYKLKLKLYKIFK